MIVCTDDPDAPEIYTEPQSLVKPLKHISGRQLAAWIFFFLLHVNINYGALDSYIEVSFSSIVRYLLDFGTWYYIALRLLQLVLLFEAIFHFVSWRRLRKLIEKLKCGGELPQGEHRRFRTAGMLLCALAVPAVLLFGLHLLVGGYQVGLNNNEPVYDLSSIPIPTLEDLGMESGDYYTYSAADVRHDILADVIYDYYCDRYAHDEPVFDYRAQYYDMCSERLAGLLADGIIKDASHANEEPAPAGWVHCAVDKSFELDGAQLRLVCDLDTHLVVVCTDDPDAPEIYTDHELLVKPLKKLAGEHLFMAFIFLVMALCTQLTPFLGTMWQYVAKHETSVRRRIRHRYSHGGGDHTDRNL